MSTIPHPAIPAPDRDWQPPAVWRQLPKRPQVTLLGQPRQALALSDADLARAVRYPIGATHETHGAGPDTLRYRQTPRLVTSDPEGHAARRWAFANDDRHTPRVATPRPRGQTQGEAQQDILLASLQSAPGHLCWVHDLCVRMGTNAAHIGAAASALGDRVQSRRLRRRSHAVDLDRPKPSPRFSVTQYRLATADPWPPAPDGWYVIGRSEEVKKGRSEEGKKGRSEEVR